MIPRIGVAIIPGRESRSWLYGSGWGRGFGPFDPGCADRVESRNEIQIAGQLAERGMKAAGSLVVSRPPAPREVTTVGTAGDQSHALTNLKRVRPACRARLVLWRCLAFLGV